MLNVRRCSTLQDKREAFSAFDPHRQTWIVSDLQSKSNLQEQLLSKHGVLERDSVLRATELWKTLSFQLKPELRLISPELAQTLFWNWIEPMQLEWARSPRAVPVVLKQMKMWMTLYADPRFAEIMAPWFQDNPESYVRWGHWFELCGTLWKRCQENDLIMLDWLPAMLLSEDLSGLHWPKELIFDLGPQISQVEGQLVKELARDRDVAVLFPEAPWLGLMKNTLKPYEILLEENYKGNPDWQPTVDRSYAFGRFSTQLAEVKDAVGRVRAWLDEGVSPSQIAIVAPDIEAYWPSLQLYLAEEGIPAAKSASVKLSSFLEIAQWLSSLRTRQRQLSSRDLEVHFFANQDRPRMAFQDFRVLFTNVYDARDLDRAKNYFEDADGLESKTSISLVEFLGWGLRSWKGSGDDLRLSSLLQVLGQEVPPDLNLEPAQWLSYVEGVACRRDFGLTPAEDEGIFCVSLTSADWLPASHGIFLNLCEESLRRLEPSPVSPGEAQKIFLDTGYAVGAGDRQELEFELLWFLNRKWEELHLCYSGSDFQGGVLTPSRLWMWAAFANGQLKNDPQIPLPTRWDQIQSQDVEQVAKLRGLSPERTNDLRFSLDRESGAVAAQLWGDLGPHRLSASSLERFWQCPFIFAAERKLKLSDDPVLDLDLDRRTRGSLLHAMLEDLTHEPMRFDWADQELEALIEVCLEREGLKIGDARLWPAVRAQYLRLARKFLEFESAWRSQFPRTNTVGREVEFECFWDTENGGFTKDPGPVRLSGRIDRIDQDSQRRYAVIDYKSGAGDNKNWNLWIEKRQIQLALYSSLIEQGLGGIPAGLVMAANFYVVKDLDRRKGFHLKDETAELYGCEDRRRNWISSEEKSRLYSELTEAIHEAVSLIVKGDFKPVPSDENNCTNCSWRNLCRAPHLN